MKEKEFPRRGQERKLPSCFFYGSECYISIFCLLVWVHLKRRKIVLVLILFMASYYQKYERIRIHVLPNKWEENHYQARKCEGFDNKDNVKKIKLEGLAGQLYSPVCLVGLCVLREIFIHLMFRWRLRQVLETAASHFTGLSMPWSLLELAHPNPLRTSLSCSQCVNRIFNCTVCDNTTLVLHTHTHTTFDSQSRSFFKSMINTRYKLLAKANYVD